MHPAMARLRSLTADKAKLAALTASELSYGHSDMRVQKQTEFINGVANRKMIVKSLECPELKIAVAGNAGGRATASTSPRSTPTAKSPTPRSARCSLAETGRGVEAARPPGLQAGAS
jgi:hypothetical protein